MLIKQEKSKNDKKGRCYYFCQCSECGEKIEVRSDHIEGKKHKCKEIYKRRLVIQKKSIKQPSRSEVVISAISKTELNKQIKAYEQFYFIL